MNPPTARDAADAAATMRAHRIPVQEWTALETAYATGGSAGLRRRLAASQVPAGADAALIAGMHAAARMLGARRDLGSDQDGS